MRRDSNETIENVKKELKEEMEYSFCSIEQAMKKELSEMVERIIQRTDTKNLLYNWNRLRKRCAHRPSRDRAIQSSLSLLIHLR